MDWKSFWLGVMAMGSLVALINFITIPWIIKAWKDALKD